MDWNTLGRLALAGGLLVSGCGGDGPEPRVDSGALDSGPIGTDSGLSTDGSALSDTGAGGGDAATSGTDSGLTGSQDCGGASYDAQAKQLDIYMMVDESASMIPVWTPVVQAINTFLSSPAADGIGVGMQLFGDSGQCDPSFYATPKVPIAALPGNAAALQGAFPALPLSDTPTLPAMQGAIQHAQQWATMYPDHKVVTLLVTDGEPDDCGSTIDNVAQAVGAGYSGSPSIQTFVIGLGFDFAGIDPVAVAGGTGQARQVDPNDSQALVNVLNEVRGQALPCDYALPTDASNLDLVNLEYTGQDGSTERLRRVDGAEACGDGAGWYYEGDRLVACEASCSMFKEDGGNVAVRVGCPVLI